MKRIEVVAGIVENKGRFLCVQRGASKYAYISEKWEFPGGKVESLESPKEALIRELHEELRLDVEVGPLFLRVEHEYPDFVIGMDAYLCTARNPEGLELSEHLDFAWLEKSEISVLDWAAADVPIVDYLRLE